MGGASKQVAGQSYVSFPMMKQLKGNYSLIPLVAIAAFGCALATFHGFRQLFKSPDAVFNRKGNPRPYEHLLKDDGTPVQYKYYSKHDYKNFKDEDRPKL
jgi:hypothetical protein